MKIRMVTNKAGMAAARDTHQGFAPNGGTNQPRCGLVGLKKRENKQCEYIPLGEKSTGETHFYFCRDNTLKNGNSFTDRLDKDYLPKVS